MSEVNAEVTIYYVGPEGFGESTKLSGEFADVIAQRGIVTGALAANGSKPQFRDREPVAPRPMAPVGAPFAGPPQQTQPTAGGAAVGRIHQQCGQPMRYVQAGVSQAGRAYPAFFKCAAGCRNPNTDREHTENA